jgi:uncharacterized protein (DUF58 family)
MKALSASVVAAIDDLEFAARLVVEGLRAGGPRSPFHGFSAEFQQHRPYRAGDDLKYLDWKLLARTDRLYSKQFRETTSMSVMLVLDASASMAYPNDGTSKFRYATVLAAALAYLISNQGDAVGIMSMSGSALAYMPARGGRVHLRSLLARLDGLAPGATWDAPRVIARSADLLRRRGVVVMISDFYDDEANTLRELRRVRGRGHDVAMLQVMSRAEVAFPFRGDVEFHDAESAGRKLIDAKAAAKAYQANVNAFLERVKTGARRDGIEHALAMTDEPPERVLREFLLRRNAPAGGAGNEGGAGVA